VTAAGRDQPGLRPAGRRARLTRMRTLGRLSAGQRLVIRLPVTREFGAL